MTTDAVYYVGPNMLALEKRFGFRPGDFRLWIALHEVTHRVQFRAVPWMKDYFLSLVDASLGHDRTRPEAARPGAGAGRRMRPQGPQPARRRAASWPSSPPTSSGRSSTRSRP